VDKPGMLLHVPQEYQKYVACCQMYSGFRSAAAYQKFMTCNLYCTVLYQLVLLVSYHCVLHCYAHCALHAICRDIVGASGISMEPAVFDTVFQHAAQRDHSTDSCCLGSFMRSRQQWLAQQLHISCSCLSTPVPVVHLR